MKTLNKVMLLGAVGRDPEMKATGGGTLVANFSLATSDRRKDPAGNWVDETTWHNLVAFGKTAEVVRDYVTKGKPVHVEGKIKTRSWDDKETGKKQYRTEVIVDSLILLGGNKEREQDNDNSEVSDDDIPF